MSNKIVQYENVEDKVTALPQTILFRGRHVTVTDANRKFLEQALVNDANAAFEAAYSSGRSR